MAKKVVTDGYKPTAKKQRVIEEEQREADEKIDFSMEFTPAEERAWIHEERCNTLVLFMSIVIAIVMGFITAYISHILGNNTTSAVIDTVLVFLVAALLKKIATPVVKYYVSKNYSADAAESASGAMVSGRSIVGSVFMYLVMALGSCIVFLSLL